MISIHKPSYAVAVLAVCALFTKIATSGPPIDNEPFTGGAVDSSGELCAEIDRDLSECVWQRQGSINSSPAGIRVICTLEGLNPNHAYTIWTHFLSDDTGARIAPPGRAAYGCSDGDGVGEFDTEGWLDTSLTGAPWTEEQWGNSNTDIVLIDHGACGAQPDQFSSPLAGCDGSFLTTCQDTPTNDEGLPWCVVVGSAVFKADSSSD